MNDHPIAAREELPKSHPPVVTPDTNPPALQRETRGLWIATVANIDWPSRSSLSPEQQRAELVSIFDRAAAAGFKTIVFHVRPAADAVYRSSIEPYIVLLAALAITPYVDRVLARRSPHTAVPAPDPIRSA